MIQQLLDDLVDSGREIGIQVAAYVHGRLALEAHAGSADTATGWMVDEKTFFPSYSTGKGIAALVVAVLMERGVLDYAAPVATYWPEFGAHGKESITVGDVLTHRAGLPSLPADARSAFRRSRISFWGDHHLLIEQFTRIPSEFQLGLQLGNPAMRRGQLVGLNARHALTDSSIDQRLSFPLEQRRRGNPCLSSDLGDPFPSTQSRTHLPTHGLRIRFRHHDLLTVSLPQLSQGWSPLRGPDQADLTP